MNQLGELAYHIWDIEFGDHTTALERERNALLISGYLEVNLGQVNNLLNTDFYLDKANDCVKPALQTEEKAIFTQLYLKDYMNKQARNTLRNAVNSSTTSSTTTTEGVTDWVELREGDTSIRRSIATSTSKNSTAKIFQASSRDAADILAKMVHSYNMYGCIPLQVAGADGGIEVTTYQRREAAGLEERVDSLNQAVSQLDQLQAQIDSVKVDIAASKINGFAKTILLPKNDDEIRLVPPSNICQ